MAIETRPSPAATRTAAAAPRPTTAAQIWGAIGAVTLTFILIVWTKWITGPYFERVPSGPTDRPDWMTALHTVWQPVFAVVALGFLYHFLVRPWRRDGQPTTDGLLCVAVAFLWFQDPLSSFTGHWFTYNSALWQMGSWANEVPGWMAFGAPGQNVAEPIIFTGAVYVWAFFGMMLAGCWVMRRTAARWPTLSGPALIGICFIALFVGDVVLEGLIWLPLGFLTYPGGHLNLFAGSWHQYPLHEGAFASALFTGLAALRFFRNDKGETVADRGIEGLGLRPGRKHLLKFLAFVGATQAIMMVTYNIPVAALIGSHPAKWPTSIQERSYFTDYVCGAGTDWLCPDGRDVQTFRPARPEHQVPFADQG